MLEGSINDWDVRRQLIVPGDADKTIEMAAAHWAHSAQRAIQQHGRFAVALSGGSTPKVIYQELAKKYRQEVDWSRVYLFWSDERAVPSDHPDSNYKMAMDSGFKDLPIPPAQIHRMKGEGNLQQNAADYEDLIKRILDKRFFDLVMLGVGEDGHTASLFPNTDALKEQTKLVVANHIFEKETWRLTLTYPCINQSDKAVIYAIGQAKESIIPLALQAAVTSPFPISTIGTADHPALWILDQKSARLLNSH
jgi:6-phosphogluconolactonase